MSDQRINSAIMLYESKKTLPSVISHNSDFIKIYTFMFPQVVQEHQLCVV